MICLIMSCLFWAGNYVMGKELMSETAAMPSSAVFWRLAISGIVMFTAGLLTVGTRIVFSIPKRELPAVLGQGVIGMGLPATLLLWAAHETSAINTTMFEAVTPVIILLGGAALGTKLKLSQISGMAISLSGCLFVIRALTPDGVQLNAFNIGDIFVLAGSLSWAVYVLWGRGTLQRVHSVAYTIWATAGAAAATGAYALLSDTGLDYPVTPTALGLMAQMVLLPTVGAYLCWNQATKTVPLPILNITQYLIPVSAVLMAHVLLKETLDGFQLFGMLLILSGIFMDPTVTVFFRRVIGRFAGR